MDYKECSAYRLLTNKCADGQECCGVKELQKNLDNYDSLKPRARLTLSDAVQFAKKCELNNCQCVPELVEIANQFPETVTEE
ncbi:MAG: hypothetical protein UV63_C0008G0022 [Microgenomates group bacterium GW2011_GWC1_43_11]|uniref:Uncharacterized protein n=2 Tax=Candidatus Gottesmaniibacteriota TaxID=1752720 RepID=A0A0G1IQ48_9BACT|nr:MAG: hypothetical protein UV63_C0008G0022 [Microgenomates group bacterium GW2011_GWC1_43_11]KKT39039.1 MAG: hypothetical protein UW22_C0002G0015 [Candidatus Gottesmanbacteria bacterium GW2011_GWB1_44_11c]KKT61501.1 MAG: hypothetical protein UW52_C0002G0015 [Candidatus Gottesmanbacteria bacterium GW2011_GWA1_44_24b]HCM81898.1 hypothetical protein [Patescibacteria group bacterium]